MMRTRFPHWLGAVVWLLSTPALLGSLWIQSAQAEPAIKGYSDYESLAKQLAELDKSGVVTVKSLGKTLGKRDVFLATIGTGAVDEKPALLIVGNVDGPHLVGSELALRIARQLAEKSQSDQAIRELLERHTVYVIPRPAPDASEAFFQRPYAERTGNDRPTDDDRDGARGEDPADDLNGDGWITMLRVADKTGPYRLHPDDPRVLIKAEPAKNETGGYSLYGEGRDNDDDGEFNEDGPGGVAFNRNFTFQYPSFKPGAGPHAVSEIESRAVADFCFSRPNIAAVFTLAAQDNLMQPWKPNPASEGARIKTALRSADSAYTDFIAEQYRKIHGGKDAPASASGEGSLAHWAYFHYGRWSFAARGWWVPKTPADPPKPGEAKPSDESRGADEINALRWLKKQGIDGFVDWKPIDHPDFPGKKVEIGGFKPLVLLNPPASELDGLGQKHCDFVVSLLKLSPRVTIDEAKVETLGGGVFRLSVTALNAGYLPTMSEMGQISGQAYPLQLSVELPKGMTLVSGSPRTTLPRLSGNGGKTTHKWLVRKTEGDARSVKITVASPAVGTHSTSVDVK